MEQLKPSPPNSSPLTPLHFLERAATIYGDAASVIYNDVSFTWSETHRRCLRLASSILALGIGRGQVVSVLAPNIPAMYELHFAVPFSGAVLNTLNTRLDSKTVSALLRHSESKLLFVDCQSKDLAIDALSLFPPESPRPVLVLIEDDEFPAGCDRIFCDTYEGMVEKGDPGFKCIKPESEFDPIVLNYTSGTTSAPKGVVHCHRGIFTITLVTLFEWSVTKNPVYLWTLPMFHANGWSFPWGIAAVGGTNVCLRRVNAAAIYTAIRHRNVTHMCGAPVVLNMLTNSGESTPLQRPVQILTAGAPPPAAVLMRTEAIGFEVSHGYGLTETGGVVVACSWKEKWNKLPATERARLKARQGLKTIGMAELDVIDPETGESVNCDGETMGEIVLRGACVMLGYLKDPEATAKSMKQGWFYTGDVGVMHPDGYLEIKDRSKDIIISGGENISSVQVESILYTHPAVNEAAVVAQPDEYWGETPCAFVSLKSHQATEKPTDKEIIEFCRAKLPHYMVPNTVVIKPELPKTSTGKIQKFVLRNLARAMGRSTVSRL